MRELAKAWRRGRDTSEVKAVISIYLVRMVLARERAEVQKRVDKVRVPLVCSAHLESCLAPAGKNGHLLVTACGCKGIILMVTIPRHWRIQCCTLTARVLERFHITNRRIGGSLSHPQVSGEQSNTQGFRNAI